MTVVGVAPKNFVSTTLGIRPLVFVPMSMRGLLSVGFRGFEDRRSYWAYLFGRLKPGVSLGQANAGLNTVYHPIVSDVEAPLQRGMRDRKSTRLNSSHSQISYAVFCLKKKNKKLTFRTQL